MALGGQDRTADPDQLRRDRSVLIAPATVAIGALTALLVVPASPPLGMLLVLSLGSVAVLGVGEWWRTGRLAAGVRVAIWVLACQLIVWVAVSSLTIGVATIAVAGVLALLGYGLHRYELLALGLLGVDE